MKFRVGLILLLLLLLSVGTQALTQGVLIPETSAQLPRMIVRSSHPPVLPRLEPVFSYKINSLDVNAKVKDLVAEVNFSQTFTNTGKTQMEVFFLFPIPHDVAVEQFALLVDGKELPAKIQKADEARKTYNEIVRKMKDPALLEWVGNGMLRSSVFLVPADEKRTKSRCRSLCFSCSTTLGA